MEQQKLFFEDIYDAYKTVVQACGGYRKVGPKLWPEKSQDASADLLRNCLNRDRPEKLDPEQTLFLEQIGRAHGCDVAFAYRAEQCNYKYETVEPEDEKAKLQMRLDKTMSDLREQIARYERLCDPGLPQRIRVTK